MAGRRKRTQDAVRLGKLVGDIETGQVRDEEPTSDELRRVMSSLGKKGGKKGGKARAAALDPARRAEIAQKAANARWRKNDR